jgi:hypothetical protein
MKSDWQTDDSKQAQTVVRETSPSETSRKSTRRTSTQSGPGGRLRVVVNPRSLRVQVPVLRRALLICPGRSPGSKGRSLPALRLRIATAILPRVESRVVSQAASLCLQWRDRAGICPDFPFKPSRAPQASFSCITQGANERFFLGAGQV